MKIATSPHRDVMPKMMKRLQGRLRFQPVPRIGKRCCPFLMSLPPDGFEHFCQHLLRESGFQEVTVTGRSGDEGIDGIGILQVNPLVSFKVLFQCKRHRKVVSAGHVGDFRGATEGRADKGIIITTGTFSADARREAIRDGAKGPELVDGQKLVTMLEELELGLTPVRALRVERDFFADFGDVARV
jgi:restriction system protein